MARGAQELQEALAKVQAELAKQTVEASTGGGRVRVEMSGTQSCQRVQIDPGLLQEGDAEKLEGLLLLAINQAIRDSQLMAARRLAPLGGSSQTEGEAE